VFGPWALQHQEGLKLQITGLDSTLQWELKSEMN
jgi:hypothetical protein